MTDLFALGIRDDWEFFMSLYIDEYEADELRLAAEPLLTLVEHSSLLKSRDEAAAAAAAERRRESSRCSIMYGDDV